MDRFTDKRGRKMRKFGKIKELVGRAVGRLALAHCLGFEADDPIWRSQRDGTIRQKSSMQLD